MPHIPINAVTWTVGAITFYTFGFKSWRIYRQTANALAQMYYVLGTTFGTALLFFGLPGLLTQDPHILHYTYFTADFFVQVSVQVQVWTLWFLGLRSRISLPKLYLFTIPASLVALTLEVMTSHVSVSQSPYLIAYIDKLPVLILKSIIYLTIALPLGFFFLSQVPSQTTLRAKAKSFTTGMIFIVVSLAATSNNIFDHGSDTYGSSIVVMIFFAIFLIAQLLRSSSGSVSRSR